MTSLARNLLSCLALLHFSAQLPAQPGAGTLDPPGAPEDYQMKTLDQVEARIPLNQQNTPGDSDAHFHITEPGSYYLTENLEITKTTGIIMDAMNVTLDLNGFSIIDSTNTAGAAILLSRTPSESGAVEVRNGIIQGLSNVADRNRGGFVIGSTIPDFLTVRNVVFQFLDSPIPVTYDGPSLWVDCEVMDCNTGFAGREAQFIRCHAQDIENSGFVVIQSLLRNCISLNNGGSGFRAGGASIFEHCMALGNTQHGFYLDSVLGSEPNTAIIRNSVARHNKGNGLHAVFGEGSFPSTYGTMTVTGSSFYSNDGYGINAGSRSFIKETAVHFNGDTGIIAGAGSEILQCGVTENEGGGILCREFLNVSVSLRRGNGITIEGCNVSGNQGTGVRALGGDGLTIRKCDIHQNGGAGIKVTPASGSSCNSVTISHCNISENNEYGIDFTIGSGSDTQSDGNRIMHNTVTRNSVTSPVPHGIHLKRVNDSRIEGNHVVGRVEISGDATVFSGFGIADPNSSNGNFFLKNTVKSFFKNYAFNGNSVYGPIISPGTGMPGSAGELSDTGKGAHPWANFSF